MFFIFVLSLIAGNSGGMVIAIINKSAREVTAGTVNLNNLFYFLLAVGVFILTQRAALRQGAYFSEKMLELHRLHLGNLIRNAELKHIEELNEADIVIKMTEDAKRTTMAIIKMVNALQAVIMIAFVLCYIVWFHLEAGLLVLAFLAIVAVLYFAFVEMLRSALHTTTDKETVLFNVLHHLLAGFKELKIAHEKNEDLFYHHLQPMARVVKAQRIEAKMLFSEIEKSANFIHYLIIGSMLFLLSSDIPPSIRFQVVTVVLFLAGQFRTLYVVFPEIANATVSTERLFRLEQQLEQVVHPVGFVRESKVRQISSFQELRVEELRFHYTDMEGKPTFALGPITLTIKAQEILFITGGNGTGKTTLLKLVTGLYPAYSGTFTLDQTAINIAEHRNLFTAVFADFHLFDGLYGIEQVDPQQVADLLRMMQLDHITQWRDRRFSNLELSAGQQKRLALIAALLEDKPIYIFDEWAAEQDPHFRAYFYEVLLQNLKSQGKTIIAVTHDDSYFSWADRVVKMQDGQLFDG